MNKGYPLMNRRHYGRFSDRLGSFIALTSLEVEGRCDGIGNRTLLGIGLANLNALN